MPLVIIDALVRNGVQRYELCARIDMQVAIMNLERQFQAYVFRRHGIQLSFISEEAGIVCLHSLVYHTVRGPYRVFRKLVKGLPFFVKIHYRDPSRSWMHLPVLPVVYFRQHVHEAHVVQPPVIRPELIKDPHRGFHLAFSPWRGCHARSDVEAVIVSELPEPGIHFSGRSLRPWLVHHRLHVVC